MKEIDDTPVPKSECEQCGSVIPRGYEDAACWPCVLKWEIEHRKKQLAAMELRIANLETQRTPQDENVDPEWY